MLDSKLNTAARINKTAKWPETAHFPGTGPPGMTCNDCWHIDGKNRCEQAARLRAVPIEKVNPIYRHTAACKYFARKEKTHAKAGRPADPERDPDSGIPY